MTLRKRDLVRHVPVLGRLVRDLDRLEAENRRVGSYLWDLSVADASAAEPYAGKEDTGGLPVPPAALRYLVAGTDDVEWFLRSGALGMKALVDMLRRNGIDPDALSAVLDYGCGCGRVLRHFAHRRGGTLHGVDRSRLAVGWCRTNLPFATYEVAGAEPRLPYPDGTFDLIYAFSVFTHLAPPMQAAWMAEMKRVLKADGLLLISLHGDTYAARLPAPEKAEYRAGRAVVIAESVAGSNLYNAFHPEAYVRRILAAAFDVLDFRPEGAVGNPTQDLYLMRSRPA